MDVVTKALVLAVQHIADRGADAGEDQDVEMLERLANVLHQATPAERQSLIAAADELGLAAWPKHVGLVRECSLDSEPGAAADGGGR